MSKQNLCQCGCGREVSASRRYFHGHKPKSAPSPASAAPPEGALAIEIIPVSEMPPARFGDPQIAEIFTCLKDLPQGKALKCAMPDRYKSCKRPRDVSAKLRASLGVIARWNGAGNVKFTAKVLMVTVLDGFIYIRRTTEDAA